MTFFEYEPNKFINVTNICEIAFLARDIHQSGQPQPVTGTEEKAGKKLIANIVLSSGTKLPPIEGDKAEALRRIISTAE